MKRIRKPNGINQSNMYADFFRARIPDEGRFVYIGGPCYSGHEQIHLNMEQTLALADWLGKVAKWARQKPKAKRGKRK